MDSNDSFSVSFDSSAEISYQNYSGNTNHESINNEQKPSAVSSQRSLIDKIILTYLKHNFSLVGLEDVMEIYNEDREDYAKIPTKKKTILKLFREHRNLIRVFYMVKCDKCNKATKIDSECTDKVKCCGNILKKNESNFFVYMPVEDQISQSIKNNWAYIKKFNTVSSTDGSISDAHDGEVLRKILEQYKDSDTNILSLCLNIDGANKFMSNTVSLWPIQLSQNYLPPEIGFQTNNIIVAGLYYGKVKVNCRDYLLPLVEELDHLNRVGLKLDIEGEEYKFMPIVTHCAVDLPAKTMLQEIKQFGGYYSCTYCKIPGEIVSIASDPKKKKKRSKHQTEDIESHKFVRYVEGDEAYEPRNEVETLKQMLAASKSKEVVDGVKDVSPLVACNHFNIIHSFSVEYMHCLLQGVQKQMLVQFLDPKFSKQAYYIRPKNRQILNKRILALKPPAHIVRKPRSLDDKAYFKASEFRFLLLYYLPVCLSGLIPHTFVEHVRRLSAAAYILLQTTMTTEEVNNAEEMMRRFVLDHQRLFGKEGMVMNIHLVQHLAESVRKLGPLWCHSAFPFERNNGVLLKMVNGTTDVLLQISSKYTLSKSVVKKFEKESTKILLGKSAQVEEQSLQVLNLKSQHILDWSNMPLSVYKRIRLHKITYTSSIYTRPKKSIDYFIELKNGDFGMVKFYIKLNGETYALMEKFEVIDYVHHIKKVRSTNQNILTLVEDIKLKYVYMKIGPNQYVCTAPNPYEIE